MRCLITTAPSGSFDEARELAERFGLEAQSRGDRAIPQLVEAAGGAPVLVLSKARADLVQRGRVFRASAGMAYLRLVRAAGEAGSRFELVRELADPAPLEPQTLREACRVARRGVLVKDAPPGHELARLGLIPLPSRRSPRIVFGWAAAQ